ncbi:hypothetical protein BJF85_11955 [Saccharomonospora sp. CUA-673]|nr:hypothetical protein BJF85_11955 [Saccharomonospora sp. CUA-673]
MSTDVLPPELQERAWSQSQCRAGRRHQGTTHSRSRMRTRSRIAAEDCRRVRPSETGVPVVGSQRTVRRVLRGLVMMSRATAAGMVP